MRLILLKLVPHRKKGWKMKEIETSAKTVEEAIKLALEELGRSREEVEVDVLSEGSHGILGIGAEEAKVRVRLLEPTPSETDSEPQGPEPGQKRDIVHDLILQ